MVQGGDRSPFLANSRPGTVHFTVGPIAEGADRIDLFLVFLFSEYGVREDFCLVANFGSVRLRRTGNSDRVGFATRECDLNEPLCGNLNLVLTRFKRPPAVSLNAT